MGYAGTDTKMDVAELLSSPRVTARGLTMAGAGAADAQTRATMRNPMKAMNMKVDKFTSGQKTKLLE
jgi:hypothetical protein